MNRTLMDMWRGRGEGKRNGGVLLDLGFKHIVGLFY